MKKTVLVALLSVAGCVSQSDPELVGEAEATLMQVPAGIGCVQITVAGASKSVQSSLSVSVGQATTFKLTGQPNGCGGVVNCGTCGSGQVCNGGICGCSCAGHTCKPGFSYCDPDSNCTCVLF